MRRSKFVSGAIGALGATMLILPQTAIADDADPVAGIVVQWRVSKDVGTKFRVTATVRNDTAETRENWSVELPYRHSVKKINGAVGVQDDSTLTLARSRPLPAGSETNFEMTVVSAGPVSRVPSTCVVAESACRVIVPGDSEQAMSGLGTGPSEQGAKGDGGESKRPTIDGAEEEYEDAQDPSSDSDTGARDLKAQTQESASPELDLTNPRPKREPSNEPTPTPKMKVKVRADVESKNQDKQTKKVRNQAKEKRAESLRARNSNKRSTEPTPSLAVSVAVISDWGIGQSVRVTVRNDSLKPISEWTVALPWALAVGAMWNATSTSGGGVVRATSVPWNGSLAPGEAVEFGFNASPGASVFVEGACFAHTSLGSTYCQLTI